MAGSSLRLTSRAVAVISIFSALIVCVRIVRIPLHVPGAGSIPWITLMIVGRAISTYPLTSTVTGFIVGVITTIAGIDFPPGPQHIIKYLVLGLVIDATYKVLPKHNVLTYVIIGAITSISKLLSVYVVAYILNIPLIVIKVVLIYVLALHTVFGVIAGLIAYSLVLAVSKVKVLRS